MKIAIWHNLPSGGGKRALHSHVRGLIARGHIVEAWCPPTADQSYLPLRALIPEHIVPLAVKTWETKRLLPTPTARYDITVDNIRFMQEHCQRCAEEIAQGGFDLLFANSCRQFFNSYMGRYVSLPSVMYLQEPCRYLYEAHPKLPWMAPPATSGAWWLPKQMRQAFRDLALLQGLRVQMREEVENAEAFDSLLVNSHFSRESVLRAYGVDSKVCYLGIDTEQFAPENVEREWFVIGVGQIMPHKNIAFVIEALSHVPEPRPPLVWVGNASKTDYLEEMMRLAHANGVRFEPKIQIDDAELTRLFNRATMMIYAPRLEPFGYVPLEANACGLPVIAVAEGGIRETIQDGVNGLLVESDPQAMAAAIVCLRNNRAYARSLGENGRRLVQERWSLSDSIDRLETRFAEALRSMGFSASISER